MLSDRLYVREGRRLVGGAVFTQRTVDGQKPGGGVKIGNASIGLGGYNFDAHNAQRPFFFTRCPVCVCL